MKKRKRAPAELSSLRSPNSAGQVELEGPQNSTLTPPPTRQVGVLIASFLMILVLLGVVGLAIALPEFFVTAVQAFVGGI